MTNDWISKGDTSSQDTEKMTDFTFYDYAPLVFKRIRTKFGITESEYMASLGPE